MARSFWLASAILGIAAACVATDASYTTPAPQAPPPVEPAPGAPEPAPLVFATPPPGSPRPPPPSSPPPPPPVAPNQPPAPPGPSRPGMPPGEVIGPRYEPPVGAIGPTCTLRPEIVPTVRRDEVELELLLVNNAPDPVTVTLAGRCPGSLVELRGLPSTYDPFQLCRVGPCLNPTNSATYTIPARGSVQIGKTTLHANGDSCNKPLPLGSMYLTASVVPDERRIDLCDSHRIHIVRDPQTGALRLARLDDPAVPASPSEQEAPPKQAPKEKPAPKEKEAPKEKPAPKKEPKRPCPACAFACPNGIPSRKIGPDGCPVCACEKFSFGE